MALSDTLLRNGFETHILNVHGNEFTILSCKLDRNKEGTKFVANDNTAAAVNPDMPLGDDQREVIVINCKRPCPPLEQGDQIFGLGFSWALLKREDNPSDTSVDYWCQKLVPGKDAP